MMTKRFPGTSEEAIRGFELMSGTSLPPDYRSFLLTYNGGVPTNDGVEIPDWHGGSTCLCTLFGIGVRQDADLVDIYEKTRSSLPDRLLPIGEDSVGNLFCIAGEGPMAGNVVLWDHEGELDEEGNSRKDYGNVYFIADDFTSFVNMLLPPTSLG